MRRFAFLGAWLFFAPASLLEAAAPAGQWWNAAYSERLNITVTAGSTAVPTDYSMFVTIDHARMVGSGRSLASGDDVRVVYWNGGGWVELDRLLDDQSSWNNYRTGLWFRTQAAIGAFATDDNYYIYYNNAAAGAPPTNWANVFLFYDDFETGGLDTTTRWTCTGTCTQSGGTLSLPTASSVYAQAAYSFGFDTRWEAEQQLVSPFANLNHFGAGDQDIFCCAGSNDWVVFWHDGFNPQWETGDNASAVGAIYTNGTPGSSHVYTFDRVGSGSVRFSLDNSPFQNETGTVPDASLRARLENAGSAPSQVVTEWVRVRKYVIPEPEANARRESTIVGGTCTVVTDIGGSAYDSSQPYWGNDEAHAVALQSDGKILVGGFGYVGWATDFAVARYNADFRLDTSFGSAGIATTNIDYDDQAYGLAIQPDGKIVVGGHDRVGVSWADDDFAVLRYDQNGALDASFNLGGVAGGPPNRAGMVTTAVDTLWDLGQPMVLQDDGKIVVAGPVRVGGSGGQYDFGVARFNPDGSIDLPFGGGGTGTVVTPVGTGHDYANALVINPDPGGYILVVGGVQNATYDFGLVRYDLSGNLDASFGAGGIVTTDLRGAEDWGTSVVVQPDGKIVMTGQSSNGTDTDFAVVRYNPDGSLDTSFGSGGMVFTPMGPGDDLGGGVALQPDGKIVVVGSANNGSDFDFAAARYNADGSLDTSFGFGGKVTTPIGGGDDQIHNVVLQPDGRIIAVGESYNTLTQDPDFAMVRYNADGSLDNTCGQVFYSIGTDSSDLSTGSPSITITSGTATLTAAQTNDVGVGDVIDYDTDNKLVYISAVVSPTEFRVQTAGGNLPGDVTGVVLNSIKRAFNSITSAVAGSSNGAHLGTADLVSLEKGLSWVCYNDGPLLETANLNGYMTNASHFVTLTVAGASQVASGVGQRHRGIEGTGTVVKPPLNGGVLVRDDFTVVEWLEIDGSSTSGANGLDANTTGTGGLFRNLLVHDFTGGAAKCYYANTTGNTLRNSVLHDCENGVVLNQDDNALENVSVHGTTRGVSASNGSTGGVAENVIATGGSSADFIQQTGGVFSVFNNNLSEDGSAGSFGGSGNLANRPAVNQFVSLTNPTDLHLRAAADAIDAGKSLATSFVNDIDDLPRPQGAAWDIGADETFFTTVVTYYRSIGIAPNLVDPGPITVTAGSPFVTKSGGPGWKTQNRGRGDVLIAGANTYIIASVDSDDMLTLASVPTTGYSGAYTIARQATTLQGWWDCIINTTACTYFPVPSADLVADGRREIGIAYKDGPFTSAVDLNGSVTDADHDVTLTADAGNRHYGVAGQGVVLDMGGTGVTAVKVQSAFVTLEWLEITGMGANGRGIHLNDSSSPQKAVVRNLLIHTGAASSTGINMASSTEDVDLYNNIIYRVGRGIDTATGAGPIRIFNNTIFECTGTGPANARGIFASDPSNPGITLWNNIVHGNGDGDIGVPGVNALSAHNLTSDTSGTTHSPAGGGIDSVPLASLNFVSTGVGSENLHIGAGSAAEDCGGVGFQPCAASSFFVSDIDGALRQTPWDLGADDIAAVTAVKLLSLSATPLDSAVELQWETGSELNNLGFHVYRSTSERGPYSRVTSALIPGLGSSPEGARYSYRDLGLANGVTYYYELEDVETTGRTERHGPVSATPQEGGGRENESSSRITVGEPEENGFRVLSERSGELVLELLTEGFYAEPLDDGTVRLSIPGFASTEEEGFPTLPVKRSWVPILAGRRVALASVQAFDEEAFDSFRLEDAGGSAIEVARETVQLRRSRSQRSRSVPAGLYPQRRAQLLETAFQEDVKKALVEMAPLRWDAVRERLVLTHRLVVRLSLYGRDAADRTRDGVRGRRYRRSASQEPRSVAARLVTREAGLYDVGFEEIFPRGQGRRGQPLQADSLRLSRQGETVPFYVAGDVFAPGSTLYFVSDGEGANPYGHEAVYELEIGVVGERMAIRSAAPSGEVTPYYWERVRKEEQRFYQAALVHAPDRWLWSALYAPAWESFSFDVSEPAVATEPSHLSVWLQGVSDLPVDPDHHIRLYVNGTFVGETRWNGKEPKRVDSELGFGILQDGANTLEIESVNDTEAAYSMVMLDRYEVSYPRRLQAVAGTLQGRWSTSGTAAIEGLSEAAVLETTDGRLTWLEDVQTTPSGIAFRADADRTYLAVSPEAVRKVAEVRRPSPSRLKDPSNRADYVMIGPREFLPFAGSLLELRRSEGLRVQAVAVEDVFSEFGFGEENPNAIRDFLSYAYHQWTVGPRYVVLLGDGTYDFKDYLGTGVVNRVPPLMVTTRYLETASDPAYAAVNGDDLLPDLAIGRLPAANVEELQAMVAKILAFETSESSLDGRTVLVADNPDRAGDFVADAESLADTVLSTREVEKIYLSRLGVAAARDEIQLAFDEGASLMSYIGHGGIHVWADENLLNIDDVASLSPQSHQPMLLTLNCLNGYFHFPYFNSLAEELLKADGKGAVAVFSPSGFSLNDEAEVLHRALLHELLDGGHRRLGDAVLAAQSAYAQSGALEDMLAIYHLFGDPAMTLR